MAVSKVYSAGADYTHNRPKRLLSAGGVVWDAHVVVVEAELGCSLSERGLSLKGVRPHNFAVDGTVDAD